MTNEKLQLLWWWMNERQRIFMQKRMGLPKPWTDDPVLRDYRFCNVFREQDTVTVWIRDNWSRPNEGSPYMWLAMAIARFINWPPTLEEIGFPSDGWDTDYRDRFIGVLNRRTEQGEKAYTGAYMVRGDIQGGYPRKSEYLAHKVIGPMWEDRHGILQVLSQRSLQKATEYLSQFYGVAGFMAYEIVTDLRHTDVLRDATDIMTWANAGPGAIRGLNRLHGRKLTSSIPQAQANEEMFQLLGLWQEANAPFIKCGPNEVEMRDIEHSLCEFDKYERARLGEGRPRNKYPGQA